MPFWLGGSNRDGHSGNGVPNQRPSASQRWSIFRTAGNYEVNRHRQEDDLPYRGSRQQTNHWLWGGGKR